MKFSGSSPRVRGAKLTITVASAPRKNAPKLSDSLVHSPRWVNAPVPSAPRRQPPRTGWFVCRSWLATACLILFGTSVSLAAEAPNDRNETHWDYDPSAYIGDGTFVLAMCRDLRGDIWIGAEDKGLFRFDRGARQWGQFKAGDGIADDNVYALACDQQGRVWAGTLNRGVSVYNGKEWKNYDFHNGPIGERIFDIEVCPKDGDVWMASSAGLTRYSIRDDKWLDYTRVDRLPSEQVSALAFDQNGDIYVGTACDGVVIGRASDRYKAWTQNRSTNGMPLTPTGAGLPVNLINDLLVAKNGVVYAATTAGLAWSNDRGRSWRFIRGEDWADKAKGLRRGPPRGWKESVAKTLLPEDYVSCLAEDPSGMIWMGFRRKGYAVFNPANLSVQALEAKGASGRDFARTILPLDQGRAWVGWYKAGASLAQQDIPTRGMPAAGGKEARAAPADAHSPAFPTPRNAGREHPRLLVFRHALASIQKTPEPHCDADGEAKGASAISLGEDWLTTGTWIGRYGRFMHALCAMNPPFDFGTGTVDAPYDSYIGEHTRKFPFNVQETRAEFVGDRPIPKNLMVEDGLRYWIHWLRTDNPRCLQVPERYGGGRRQAEWDDHGEAYPFAWEGPHIFFDLVVSDGSRQAKEGEKRRHPGVFLLSLYFMNKDGHAGNNRFRDYEIIIKPIVGDGLFWEQKPGWEDRFDALPALAAARVRDFWGGVYKQFLIREGEYTIKIGRNYSFNTILSGIFLDKVAGDVGAPITMTDAAWAGCADGAAGHSAAEDKR